MPHQQDEEAARATAQPKRGGRPKLRPAECQQFLELLAEGTDLDAVCRHLEVSVQTYQRWRVQFKAMRPEWVSFRNRQTSKPFSENVKT